MMAFELSGADKPTYPQVWQCVGMIVAVYGLGYLIASTSPLKHWPIILVGFLGKVLGPLGFAHSFIQGVFPLKFGWNIVFNDFIWWIPFGYILFEIWKSNKCPLGEPIAITEEQFSNFDKIKRASFINSLSGFKSSNLIGTTNSKGQTNLSIVSSVFHLGASPALIGFIIRPDTVRRDTLENIKETKEFTINHVNKDIIKESHQTSARYAKDISEFKACGLNEQYLGSFKAPFVLNSRIKMAVELVRVEKLPENGVHLIIGSIKTVHLPSGVMKDDGHVEIQRAGTICVSGLDTYLETSPLGRLSYAKPNKGPVWI